MGYVYRWSDITFRSTIAGADTGLLPGQHLCAIKANLQPGARVRTTWRCTPACGPITPSPTRKKH